MAGEPNPAATFVFRYKSNDALKRMLIIPRTPSPSPEPTEEPEADTTALDDELRALQTRMEEITKQREQTQQHAKIKRERGADDDNPRPRRIARAHAGDLQLELDDEGNWRDRSKTLPPAERIVITID